MRKRFQEDKYFLEMLDAEREYRAKQSGNDAQKPFVTPLLFAIKDSLFRISILLCFLIGVLLSLLFKGS